MKKIILLALTALVMVGCDVKQPDGTYKPSSYRTYIIDSCEYIGYAAGTRSDYLAHKGNCRFCKERRQKELEELVIKLKGEHYGIPQ
jgi:hypothetical protein